MVGEKLMKANQFVNEFVKADDALIFELLTGAVFALIIGYAAMNIGVFINGTVGNALVATYPTTLTSRTAMQNSSVKNLQNLTGDLSSNTKMVSTAYLITIITLPLMAVVMIKKFL